MGVHNVFTPTEFRHRIKNNDVVAVEFYAISSKESKAIAPAFARCSNLSRFSQILFINVDVGKLPDLAQELGIGSVPVFQLYKGGNKIAEKQGSEETELLEFLEAGL